MKFILSIVSFLSLVASLVAVDPAKLEKGHIEEEPHYHDISTDKIQDLLKKGEKVVFVDARPVEFDEGSRLPSAVFIPYNASDTIIRDKLPERDAVIVIYCTSGKCTTSKLLAERLVDKRYTNVYRYVEGLRGWMEAGHPLENDPRK